MRLPKLIADPTPTLPLLVALRDDEEEYVRRSVANHLNDISKDHPEFVAKLAKDWMKVGNGKREKLLRHACRTLIKQGHPQTLEVFGYASPQITLDSLLIETPSLELGDILKFTICIKSLSNQAQPLIIDYAIYHKKNNGSLIAKVFKWKILTLASHGEITLGRCHAIRQVTTRRYYSGQQALSLRINGQEYGYAEFNLKC
jgi:hypothetical protein